MKRPLGWYTLALIIGIITGRYFEKGVILFLLCSCVVCVLCYWALNFKELLYLPVFLILGFTLVTNSMSYKNKEMDEFAHNGNDNVIVTGIIKDKTMTQKNKYKIIVQTERIEFSENRKLNVKMNIIVYLKQGINPKIGQLVRIDGGIAPLEEARNPGGWNEFNYLKSRKIEYKMFADKIEKDGMVNKMFTILPKIREKVGDNFDKVLPTQHAGIMKAIIIGDKSELSDESAELYRDAGIYHIFAVSGLHVSIMAVLINGMLAKVIGKKASAVASIILLIAYCFFTGSSVSTVRAVLMACVFIISQIAFLESDVISSAFFSMLCLLIYEPLYLLDVGFLYSYSCVFSIIIITPALERIYNILNAKFPLIFRVKNKTILQLFFVSIAISIGAFPISAYFFYQFSLIGILLNIIIVPTVFLLVIGGFIIAVLTFFSVAISSFIAIVCMFVLYVYEFLAMVGTSLPFAVITTGRPSPFILISYYIFVICACYKIYNIKNIKLRTILFYVSFCLLFTSVSIEVLKPKKLEVTMLDIGQGDSIVITKGKTAFVIDGGGNPRQPIGENTGKWVVAPYLTYKAIETVEGVFVTHIDADHTIGIIELLALKKVKTLYLPKGSIDLENNYYNQLMENAKINNTKVEYIEKGFMLDNNKGLTIKCLSPFGKDATDNELSLVLQVSYHDADFLFTGDIGFETENEIIDIDESIASEVLKVAHHGSKYSTGGDFLDEVKPDFAIISVSENNSYGHPTTEVLDRLKERDIKIFSTAQNGAIQISTDGFKIDLKTMLRGGALYD